MANDFGISGFDFSSALGSSSGTFDPSSFFNPTNRAGSSPWGVPFSNPGDQPATATASAPASSGTIATSTSTTTKAEVLGAGVDTTTTTSKLNESELGHWLGRIAVIILGFVFVAVGLTMFRHGVTVVEAVKGTKP